LRRRNNSPPCTPLPSAPLHAPHRIRPPEPLRPSYSAAESTSLRSASPCRCSPRSAAATESRPVSCAPPRVCPSLCCRLCVPTPVPLPPHSASQLRCPSRQTVPPAALSAPTDTHPPFFPCKHKSARPSRAPPAPTPRTPALLAPPVHP